MAVAKPKPIPTPEKDLGGRPSSDYDPELVRDISVQRLIAHYNANPTILRERMKRDPGLTEKLRAKALFYDSTVRAWLQAVDYVPRDHPDYKREVVFRFWCLRLDPAQPPEVLNRNPEREAFLRRQNFFYNFDTNSKPWLDAIERVRHDRCIKLIVPPPLLDEDDEEWV